MKIGLLSDLHAAPGALEAALRELDREHVDAIAILGDIVGYHAEPEACVARVRSLGAVVVAGNHDRAAVSDAEPAGFSPRARSALAWTRRALSDEARAFLASLPTTARVGRALLVHAALSPEPNDTARITSPELAAASLERLASGAFGATIACFGHTHRAGVFALERGAPRASGGRSARRVSFGDAAALVNPGSVGLPRDGDARPSFAVLDDEAREVRFGRAAYDGRPAPAPPPGLLARLRRALRG